MEHINNEGLQHLINKMADQLLTIAVLEKTIKDLEARNKQLDDQVFRLNNELQDRIHTTIVNMERLRAHELSDELFELKKEHAHLKEEHTHLNEAYSATVLENNKLRDENTALKEKNDTLRTNNVELVFKFMHCMSETTKLVNDVNKLKELVKEQPSLAEDFFNQLKEQGEKVKNKFL